MNDQKSALRAKMRGVATQRTDAGARSARLAARLRAWPLWQLSGAVFAFASVAGEPDVLDPWPEDKRIALPRVSGEHLVFHWVAGRGNLAAGRFGIAEPAETDTPAKNTFDLILVPGLAFDLRGGRLGRGRGFYDRFLADAGGVRAGICFDDQLVEDVPGEAHDLRMDFVITPSSIYRCGS